MASTAAQALAGSNRDVVANRRFIRMANMSAAEVLKAELAGLVPVKKSASASSFKTAAAPAPAPAAAPAPADPTPPSTSTSDHDVLPPAAPAPIAEDEADVPGLGTPGPNASEPHSDMVVDGTNDGDHVMDEAPAQESPHGAKRKRDVLEEEEAEEAEETIELEDDEAPPDADQSAYALKVNADGTVEQEDRVK